MDQKTLYDYLIKIQAIAKIGLLYSRDPYALRNYLEVQALTKEMLENIQGVNLARNNYFERDVYPTPNISVRTVVSNDQGEFLMVREVRDGGFSFPGGWIDLYDAPSEAATREVLEEAGAEVEITNLVGVLNRTPFQHPDSVPAYVIIFKARFIAFVQEHDHEITELKWVNAHDLPPLSPMMTLQETKRILEAAASGETIFD